MKGKNLVVRVMSLLLDFPVWGEVWHLSRR